MSNRQPDAVIFDIGNVLIGWQPEVFYDREVGKARRRALFDTVDLHAVNERSDRGENFHDLMAETLAAHPDFAPELTIWRDRWIDLATPVIAPSVALLRQLRAQGVPVFALSNFGIQTFEMAQAKYDFLSEFDRAYISGHMGVTKPSPRIYEMVEQDCGLPPEGLLFADDRAENITAAQARGWQGHLFDGPQGWAARLTQAGLLPEETP